MAELFHQRTNYINIIYNIYYRLSNYFKLLDYSKVYFSAYQGYKTLFYYKKEVIIKLFNAQIIVLFLFLLPLNAVDNRKEVINNQIISTNIKRANQIGLTGARFLKTINTIQNKVFSYKSRFYNNTVLDNIF